MKNVHATPTSGRGVQHARPPRGALARPAKTAEPQTITRWWVVGNDRLIGSIHHRPGTPDGKTIITSPVVQVRFIGVDGTPIAFTESGNAYWLGKPAETFGVERAQMFVWQKSQVGAPPSPPRKPDPANQTTLFRLMD